MPFDPVVVEQLRELGGDPLVRKLLRTFADHAPERRASLARAAAARDAEGLARAVHSLRSSSAMLGARELSKLAGELEALADAGRLNEVISRLPRLEASLDEVLEWIGAELERATPGE